MNIADSSASNNDSGSVKHIVNNIRSDETFDYLFLNQLLSEIGWLLGRRIWYNFPSW